MASIPGLDWEHKESFNLDDVEDCREVGFMVNLAALYTPTAVQGSNEFSLATPMAEYFGILQTRCDMYKYLNEDGDSDYCPVLIVLIMVFTLQCLKLIIWTVNRKMILLVL